jgi:glycosyltransferase involved in cell wall biosynthesis
VCFDAGLNVPFEEIMQASDICITTSVMEGFGMVYLEPWLMDVPVVGRNLPNVTVDLIQAGIEFPLLYNSVLVEYKGSRLDFAAMPMNDQMAYIQHIVENIILQKDLFSQNPFMENLLTSFDIRIIEKNKSIIRKNFSLENYARRLERIYQKVIG